MAVTIDYSKLKVIPDPDTYEWWAGAKEGKLLIRQCNNCGHKWFPPLPACARCTSMDLGWFETPGRGVIHSYIVVEQAILGAFVDAVPYAVVLVELDGTKEPDGSLTRICGVLVDDAEKAAIGLPVSVEFDATTDEDIVVARWKISGQTTNAWRFSE